MAEVEAVLGVVSKDGVIDVGIEAGSGRSAYAVSIASGALAIAGNRVTLIGIVLVASAEFYDRIEEVPCCSGHTGGSVVVVEIPTCFSVVGDVASFACDGSGADRSLDAAARMSVNPYVLQQNVVSLCIGVDAVSIEVCHGIMSATG